MSDAKTNTFVAPRMWLSFIYHERKFSRLLTNEGTENAHTRGKKPLTSFNNIY